MNVLFTTQSISIDLFHGLHAALAARGGVDRAGYTVADAWYWRSWKQRNPDFEARGHLILKEWEVTSRRHEPVDWALLRRYEERLGSPGLFGAIVADRRLLYGPNCTFAQDYRRRMPDAELLSVLQAAVIEMERLFDTLKPDVVYGFICVTVLEYLAYLFARSRGIRYLNLRALRVGNRVAINSTLNDPSPELALAFESARNGNSRSIELARAHIARIRGGAMSYEGTVAPSAKPAVRVKFGAATAGKLLRLAGNLVSFWNSDAARDNHCPGLLRPLLFRGLVAPLRARRTRFALRAQMLSGPRELGQQRYAFFPMHTEPEVSLLVYSRPFLNQIEAIRAIALSLPADMALVVKEHPGMVGKRRIGYYRKLLDIPKVRLAAPETNARVWSSSAKLVTVLSSSVALEAAIMRTPVLSLGRCAFELLPPTMVRVAGNLRDLAADIGSLLQEHAHDESALEAYIAAIYDCTVGVNFYTTLLGRSDGHADQATSFGADIAALADFCVEALKAPPRYPSSGVPVSAW
jgi:hypothetical protein